MKILIFSHKEIWKSSASPTGWSTDGGFAFHMQAIASLADELEIVCFESQSKPDGEVFFKDPKLSFSTIKLRPYSGVKRKLWVIWLAISRLPFFVSKIRQANLIHTPIPSDLSTIAMLLTRWMRKPLFIRHCGDWNKPKTRAEFFWKNFMVKHAGKKVTCLATGGGTQPPSDKNPQVRWIFSSSLIESEITALLANKKPPISINKVRLVTVSRQTVNKGAGRTISAVKILKDKGFDITFTIIGDGDYLGTLKSKVLDLGLTQNINFTGQLDNQGVMSALQQAHIFTFPSTASEGFPKAVLEAMATGLPVIASHTSVLPELVKNTHSGFALNDLSPESLAGALEELITNKELYSTCSINAANTAQQFSLERWVDYIGEQINREFGWELKRKTQIIK